MPSYLVDTNVLLRFSNQESGQYPVIHRAIRALMADGHSLVTTGQNLVEAWNVMTRPATQNGFGFLPQEAFEAHREIETIFFRLPGTLDTYSTWRSLVLRYAVCGVQVHDARLVAVILAHGIRHILTLDAKDFRRYASEGIVVVDPRDLVEA